MLLSVLSGTVSFGVNGSGQVLSEKQSFQSRVECSEGEISQWNNAVGDLLL